MSNELQETKTQAVSTQTQEDYKAIALQWLKSTGNLQKFTQQEQEQFLDICSAYGLNPIKKEVYGIKYGNNFNLIVGFETYLKRAERSGLLDGWETEFKGNEKDGSLTAVVTIYRKDWKKPFKHEVYLEEYDQHNQMWKTKPRTMLRKVAIAQAFRQCFSVELGGMLYTAEELPDTQNAVDTVDIQNIRNVTPVQEAVKDENDVKKLQHAPYTPEQTEELKNLLESHYDDGKPMFSEKEVYDAKIYLCQHGGEAALDYVKKQVSAKINAYFNAQGGN